MSEKDTATDTRKETPSPRRKSAAKKAGQTPDRRRRHKGLGAWYMLKDGRSMSLSFFKRNGWLILMAMVAVIWLISQRYSNQSRMEHIKGLQKELRRAESEKLDAKADYMSLIRETEMRRLMKENNLNLDYQEQPPYVLVR